MQYPLTEKIGHPDLLVGREKEFRLLDKWLKKIPNRLSKSRVIVARRKSGKTALVQRIFNQLWSENGPVIPFYFEIAESKIWYPAFAIKYYRTFASHYISFLERAEQLVNSPLSLEEIREYGVANAIKPFIKDVDSLFKGMERGSYYDLMWETAYSAPHRYAAVFETRFLVILDEFQNITQYIYRDEKCDGQPDETLAGSFHDYSESKIAPMLVTGSYISLLLNILSKYLEAGRLKQTQLSPYLNTTEEGLQAVYKYAEFCQEPITNETAVQINELCQLDPFFISCVIQSDFENKDLTTSEGVINTVHYEISNRKSEMSKTWNEYLNETLNTVNNRHAKQLLLYLTQQSQQDWTPQRLKEKLSLPLEVSDIQQRLIMLSEADLIERGDSDIDFHGLQDGSLNLILRHRLEKEISGFAPDFKQEFNQKLALEAENQTLQGKLNQLSGYFAEYQLATAFRIKKQLALDEFFTHVVDHTPLNFTIVKQRVHLQDQNGQVFEIDVVAESSCGRTVVVEVKKRQTKSNPEMVEVFWEKVQVYLGLFPTKRVLPAFLSLGGFTREAKVLCENKGIGMASRLAHY